MPESAQSTRPDGDRTMIRIQEGSRPTALLTIVPALLGFFPESSFVIIGTDPDTHQVIVTIRYDLPDPADNEICEEIAEHAIAVLGSNHLIAAAAVGYGPEELVRPLARALLEFAASSGIAVHDVLRLHDGRYWFCSAEDHSPTEGTPFTLDPEVAATAIGQGPLLAGRDMLAAQVAGLGGVARDSMREATRRAEQHAEQVIAQAHRSGGHDAARRALAAEGLSVVEELITAYREGGQYQTHDQLARLSVALKDLRVRDDAWARMDPSHNTEHQRLWTDLVRRAEPGHVAPAASLLAFSAWQAGNGVLANIALDRAQADDPHYSMARLLRNVISSGIPPSVAIPMTPEEVADAYDTRHDEHDDLANDAPDSHGDEEAGNVERAATTDLAGASA